MNYTAEQLAEFARQIQAGSFNLKAAVKDNTIVILAEAVGMYQLEDIRTLTRMAMIIKPYNGNMIQITLS